MRNPISMRMPSLTAQVYTASLNTGAPSKATCFSTSSDSRQEMATPAMVTPAAAARGIHRPPSPATRAASNGKSAIHSSRSGFRPTSSTLQRSNVGDVDAVLLPEQHHQDGEANGRFGRGHGEHEEHEYLAVDV